MTHMEIRRMPRIAAAAVATAAMIICGIATAPAANADDDTKLGVELGDGARAHTTVALDQPAVKTDALKAIVKWRTDAYNDQSLVIKNDDGKTGTWKQFIDDSIGKETYLSPKWSNALERIAIQRVAESGFTHSNTRLNGTPFTTAEYEADDDDVQSVLEGLGWRETNSRALTVTEVVDQWATQKSAFKQAAADGTLASDLGDDGDDDDDAAMNAELQKYGNYLSIVLPLTHYGFAANGGDMFVGEMNMLADDDDDDDDDKVDESSTNLKGRYTVPLAVGKAWDPKPQAQPTTLVIGSSTPAKAVSGKSSAIEYDATGWKSSNPAVATVKNGTITGVGLGTTTLTGRLSDGRTVSTTVKVSQFRDVTTTTPHSDDIAWLANSGIAKGYDDGTFGGMRDVVRQDMAAFLYRLAGSPAFDETKAVNPFNDVNPKTSHYKEILWLAQTGVTKGYEDGSFGGMRTVVRQDMAAFLHRYASNVAHADGTSGAGLKFTDVNADTSHADDIVWLGKTGVTEGYEDGSFGGMRTVVRQDMAAFLHRMSTNVIK